MDHALTVKVIECINMKKEIKNHYTDLELYTVDNIYNKKRQI